MKYLETELLAKILDEGMKSFEGSMFRVTEISGMQIYENKSGIITIIPTIRIVRQVPIHTINQQYDDRIRKNR